MMGTESILMKAFLTLVVSWLAVTTDLPASFDHPRVALAPAEQIAALRYPTVNPAFRPSVLAVYDDANRIIFLNDKWTGTSAVDLSVLVHEMVHHLQNRGAVKYACQGAREAPAYAAQNRFLGLFGRDVVGAFELDEMSLKLMTSCLFL